MYKVLFEKRAQKEFMKLDRSAQEIVAKGLKEFEKGNFFGDKALKGKYNGKFRKRVGNYRIIIKKMILSLLRLFLLLIEKRSTNYRNAHS